jgi:hypothetical protein
MADNAYELMRKMVADAERRGLVGAVCQPGEVMIYDEDGNVVGKGVVDDDGDLVAGHLAMPVPAGLSPYIADSPVDAPE